MASKTSKPSRYHSVKGNFFPKYPHKCKGKTSIEFKSKLEYRLMKYLDSNPAIAEWDYEKIVIPYFDKSSNKNRRYFVDFIAKIKSGMGTYQTVLIEVKGKRETIKPVKSKNQSQASFNEAMKVWITNNCKWDQARKYAKARNATFTIITEEQLLY